MMLGALIFIIIAIIAFCIAACNPKNLVAKEPPVLNIPERFKHPPKTTKTEFTFDEECHKTNIVAFWFPFLLTFFITAIWFNMQLPLIGTLAALFVALLAGSIGMSIGHSVNLDKAKKREIPDDDPRVIYEKKERNIGTVKGMLTLADLLKHTRSAIDNVTNVEEWKKTK